MSNVFVVNAAIDSNIAKSPRLAYENLSSTASTITASHDTANAVYLYDGLTTLKWKPANATSSIQFDGTFLNTDFVGIAGANWASSACTITVKDSGGNTLASASGLKDNQPVLFVFTKQTYTTIKIEFSCANTSLEVGEIYFGESMLFERNVSVGYKPGRWSTNDVVTIGRTEQNQFGRSTISARGTTESFKINYVTAAFMELDYYNFINDARGVPVFFLWNKSNVSHAVFGQWSASQPTFESSLLSSINININGVT